MLEAFVHLGFFFAMMAPAPALGMGPSFAIVRSFDPCTMTHMLLHAQIRRQRPLS